MSNNKSALFACSKCFKRYPYEDLSSGQQLCKVCKFYILQIKCKFTLKIIALRNVEVHTL